MGIRLQEVALTVDSAGAGTADFLANGEVMEVRCNGTAYGSTADFKITRLRSGGTILNLTNAQGPWQYAPRQTTHDNTGSALTSYDTFPADEECRLTIAQSAASAAGTVFIYFSRPSRL